MLKDSLSWLADDYYYSHFDAHLSVHEWGMRTVNKKKGEKKK